MEIHGMNSTQGISQHNNSEREQSFQQLSTVTTGYQENQNSPSSSSSSLSAASTSSTASSILTAASTVSSTSSSAFPSLMGDELHSASGAPSSTHYFPPLNLADHSSHSPKSIQSSINPSSSSFQQSINANQSRNPLSARSNDGEHDSNYTDNNLNQPKSMNSFQQNEMYTSGPNGSEYANYSSSQYANNAFHQQYDSLPPSALPAGGMASNHSNGTNNNPTAANTSSSLLRHSITCLECSYPLDDDDLSFAPCQCGARLCLLCFDSHLSQSTECPACRRTISIGQFSQQFIDEYRMAIQVKVERRQQQQQHSNLNGGVSAHSRSGFPAHQNANQNYVNVNQQQQQQNQSPFSANRKKFVRSPQLAPQGAHHSPVFNAANAPSHLGSAHPHQHQHQHQLLNPGANVGVNANQHSPNFGAVNVSVNGNNPNSPGPVLTSARVLQRNLMYVVGLPVHLAKEDILKKKEYFGKFGKIIKIAISKKTVNANQKGESSSPLSSGLGAPNERSLYSAYVTFKRDEDCATSIRCTNGANLGGSIVRATYGTNKYCSWFLKGQPCNSSQCLYLHSSAPDEDCCTKEDLLVMDKLAKMNINAEREELKHAQNDDSIIHQFISGMSQQQLQNFAQLAQTINVYQLNYLSFLVPVISEVLNMNINVERTPNTQERHLALNSHATQNATNAVNRSTFHSAFFTQQQQQQQTLALAQQQVQVLSNPRDRSSSGGNGSAGNASGNTNVTSNVATVGANGGARMAQLQSNRSGAQLLTVQNTAPIRLSPVDGLHQGGVNYDAAIQQQLTTSASWSTGGSSDFHAYSSRSGYANYNASNQSPQPHAQSHSQSQSPNQIVRSSHSASSTPSILPGRSVPSPPPGTSSASSASGASSSRSSPQVFSSRSAYSPLGATNELPPASSSSHAHVQSDYVKSIYEEGSLLDQPNATSRGGFDDYPPTQHEHYASSRSGPVDSVHNNSNPNNANFHYQTYQQQQQGSNSPYSQKQLLQSQQQKEYTVSNIRNSSRFYTQQPQQQASAYLGDLAASDSHSASEQSGYAASASALASSAITGNSMNSMFQTLSLADNEITRKKANQNLTASPADGGYSLFNNSFNSSVSSSAPPSLNGSPSRSMTLPIGKRSVSPSYVNAFPLMNLNVNSAASLNYGGAPNNFQLPSSAVQLSGADKSANTNEWNVQTSSATNGNMSGINEDNGPNSAPSSTSASSSAHTMSFFGSSTSPFHAFHAADASPAISTATLSQSHPAALSSPFLHYKQPQKTDGTKADQQASLFTLF